MKSEYKSSLIPENIEGKHLDIAKTVQRLSNEEALDTYNIAKMILLRPFLWQNLPGFEGATFELYKLDNSDEGTVMQKGDFMKIDIPGPGPHNGNGFDWVTVEMIEEHFDPEVDNSFGIMLRPSPEPGKKRTKVAAHFFESKATSTLIIKRTQKALTAYYHGRNEVPNLKGTSLFDKLRNAFVSIGAMAGLSKLQWKLLIEGLLESDIKINGKHP